MGALHRRGMIGLLAGAATCALAGASFAQSRADFPDAAKWDQLAKTKVVTDARGAYVANHPPEIKAMAGKPFEITGFMSPIETKVMTTHFILMRFPINCPFCDPANPNESIEVFTDKPVKFSDSAAMKISGVFSLENDPGAGLFFRISNASAVDTTS